MNEHLIEILARDLVAGLAPYKREVYQYVVGIEDELASRSETSDQFMSLLVKHTPHKQAAAHFNMTYGELMMLMREIETEIDAKLKKKLKQVQWIDYTEQLNPRTQSRMDFLLLI